MTKPKAKYRGKSAFSERIRWRIAATRSSLAVAESALRARSEPDLAGAGADAIIQAAQAMADAALRFRLSCDNA